MAKKIANGNATVLRLPDLDQSKSALPNRLTSASSSARTTLRPPQGEAKPSEF
jgi:hypothetical protein